MVGNSDFIILSLSIPLIDLEMAIAYWNIVMKGKFKFLELWCTFLKVILFLGWTKDYTHPTGISSTARIIFTDGSHDLYILLL